ncbi:hypothetical protein [Morganella morganii]|uniref:hypothetical protein n=1 Tax=Morganella morganii TaxID=582 RepID=UPI0034D3A602
MTTQYDDPRYRAPELAQFYDMDNEWRTGFDMYLTRVATAGRILDPGCGLSESRQTAILHLLADALHGHTAAIRRTDYTIEQSRALFQPVLALITELIESHGASLS